MGFLPQLMETVFRIDSIWEKYWGFVWRKLSWKGTNKSLCDLSGHYHAALGKTELCMDQGGSSVVWEGQVRKGSHLIFWPFALMDTPLPWLPPSSSVQSWDISSQGAHHCANIGLADLLPCSQKFVTDLKRREMHMTDREAVPAKFPGLFHSFLSQTKPGPSPLQAQRCEHCGRGESTPKSAGAEVAELEEQRRPCEAMGRSTLFLSP